MYRKHGLWVLLQRLWSGPGQRLLFAHWWRRHQPLQRWAYFMPIEFHTCGSVAFYRVVVVVVEFLHVNSNNCNKITCFVRIKIQTHLFIMTMCKLIVYTSINMSNFIIILYFSWSLQRYNGWWARLDIRPSILSHWLLLDGHRRTGSVPYVFCPRLKSLCFIILT